MRECLTKVDARLLVETAYHPSCLVAIEGGVGDELRLEDPFARDDQGAS